MLKNWRQFLPKIGLAMNAGAALAYSGRVMDAYNDLSDAA